MCPVVTRYGFAAALTVMRVTDSEARSSQTLAILRHRGEFDSSFGSCDQPVAPDRCPYQSLSNGDLIVCELFEPSQFISGQPARAQAPSTCRFLVACVGTAGKPDRCALGDARSRAKLMRDLSA
jgi:hypothetical protein